MLPAGIDSIYVIHYISAVYNSPHCIPSYHSISTYVLLIDNVQQCTYIIYICAIYNIKNKLKWGRVCMKVKMVSVNNT